MPSLRLSSHPIGRDQRSIPKPKFQPRAQIVLTCGLRFIFSTSLAIGRRASRWCPIVNCLRLPYFMPAAITPHPILITVNITWKSSPTCKRFVWTLSHYSVSPILYRSETRYICAPAATYTAASVRTPFRTENKSQANKAVNRSAQSRFLTNQRPSFAPGYLGRSAYF